MLDELWAIEIATGRGSLHQHIPLNRIISPPPFFSLSDAPPVWKIWTHMEVTHPPLYEIILQLWMDLFGNSDISGRLLSGSCAVIAVAALFDVVRLQAGLQPAVWTGLLM